MLGNSINSASVPDEVTANNNTVDAAMIGSTDDVILEFAGAATVSANFIAETNSGTEGTTIRVTSAGFYVVSFSFVFTGAVSIASGISFGASNATPITTDPVVDVANVIYSQTATAAVDTNVQCGGEVVVRVEQADIASANGATFRFHASNNADGPPVGIDVSTAQYRIEKIASLST